MNDTDTDTDTDGPVADWDCGSGQCDPNTGCPACTERDHWMRTR